jgi:curved DNA-binding protein CbpA
VDEKDFYSILQIASDASTEDIKTSYRRLALEHHPDRANDPQATERMQRINEAYSILVDPLKREQYDLERASQFQEALAKFDEKQEDVEDIDRTQEIKVSKEQIEKRRSWARNQLKVIFRILLFTTALFLWALVTGQVNFAVLTLIVVISLQVVFSVVVRIRNLSFPGRANND